MHVHDGLERGRNEQARQQVRDDPGRRGQHHGIVGAERDRPVGTSQAGDATIGDAEAGDPAAKLEAGAAAGQCRDRRVDQHRRQAVAGEQRDAGIATGHQRLPQHRGEQPGERLLGLRVERGDGQRGDQRAVERLLAEPL